MIWRARTLLVALPACVALAALGPFASPADAGFGAETFEAGTCVNHTCTYGSVEADHKEAFTQAAGHPPWGITKFVMKHSGSDVEGASVRRIRVDVPPGLAANPEALAQCSPAQFKSDPAGCPAGSVVGSTEMEAVAEPLGIPLPLPSLTGTVYNLEPEAGAPLYFGIAVEPTGELVSPIRIFLIGHVDYTGDYHEFFEIREVPNEAEVNPVLPVKAPLKVLMSKLNFDGNAGRGDFLTLPSVCSSTTTSHLELESWNGEIAHTETHTPVGVEGCGAVPFRPSLTITPETAQSDAPDGALADLHAPQNEAAGEINTADVRDVRALLPEGLTLNPSAAHGLQACSPAQIGIGTSSEFGCPPASAIGAVTIETDLPPGSLTGFAYLGDPAGLPITGPPYTVYVDAEWRGHGVNVKLQGTATPNPVSGRLEVSFVGNPQLPFSDLLLRPTAGARAPLANPLACGTGHTETRFAPWTGLAEWLSSTAFTTTGCASPLPFSPVQSSQSVPHNGGAYTAFTFTLTRKDGEQYPAKLTTVLPPGLVGVIPSVPLCGEPQAQTGSCPASSVIGTATVLAGAGPEPYEFKGPVSLTGPYAGSPYGLSIPVPAVAGPFDLGTVVTRVAIGVDPYSGRVIASTVLPTIEGGVPLRLKSISVLVNRGNFLLNPTNCSALSTDSSLVSTFAGAGAASSAFQVQNCGALAFKPTFSAGTSLNFSRLNGAGLQVSVTQGPHEANIHSVVASLPLQLPSRLTTLQKACPEATFAASPFACPSGSKVGSATVSTPVLPSKLSGPAYLVSHGGAAFPDLDIVLEGSGVRVILVGNTNIKDGITTSTFASIPDVPVSSFSLSLPTGPNSALSAFGNLCAKPLLMPTTIVAQNGAQFKQSTRVRVAGCGVTILGWRVRHHKLYLRLRTRSAGMVVAKGRRLRTRSVRTHKSSTFTLVIPLTRAGIAETRRLHRHHRALKITVEVSFAPEGKREAATTATAKVAFRR